MSIFILKFDCTRAVSHDTSNSVAYCIMLLLYDKKTLYINIFLYTCRGEMEPTDDGLQKLVKTMKALANPIRLRIIALLEKEPRHAYALHPHKRIEENRIDRGNRECGSGRTTISENLRTH